MDREFIKRKKEVCYSHKSCNACNPKGLAQVWKLGLLSAPHGLRFETQ